jgi:hypothetical protein
VRVCAWGEDGDAGKPYADYLFPSVNGGRAGDRFIVLQGRGAAEGLPVGSSLAGNVYSHYPPLSASARAPLLTSM